MNHRVTLFATTLAMSGLLGGCASSGQPISTNAHENVKADASILVHGIT